MTTTEQHETKRGYHFTGNTLRNCEPIPAIGEWISVSGPVIPCKSGLHMSEHPFDALQYAPGCMLHVVEIRGDLQSHGNTLDKWVGRERRIIATIDATEILRSFARGCALSVYHLWDYPDIVLMYLKTGDESIRAAARAAAMDAARAAAMDAAMAAARDAAWDAAWDAAIAAARAAARDAAMAAARAAARDAAMAAAMAAARDAAWDAAWDAAIAAARAAARDAAMAAARDAAWDAAWDAARAAQREKLQEIVDEAFRKELNK